MKDIAVRNAISLNFLTDEHHHSLLLCAKIRDGIKQNVELYRIKRYTDWFYKEYIDKHFTEEEKIIFPVLGDDNKMVKKAKAEHRRLRRLFENTGNIAKSLAKLEEELENHIRYEERVLLNEIKKTALPEQLELIAVLHKNYEFHENEELIFWKTNEYL